MKEGHALCINCGREPEKKDIPVEKSLDSTTLEKAPGNYQAMA